MSDETNYGTDQNTTPPAAGTAERVGFCQDCGTPLTRETMRQVGTGVFCEPCLTARVGTMPGHSTVPPVAGVPPPAGFPGSFPVEGTPHPVLAALLSIIPGVGTMYNGQYAKGIAYLLMISVLDSMSKASHFEFFGLLAGVLWIYQIFDAYQTAKARLEGRPLPNPFGLNEIGERLGFGKNWGNSAGATAAAAGASAPPTSAAAAAAAGYTPVSYAPPGYTPASGPVPSGPDWVGYVPPTNFASAPPPPTAAQGSAPWGQAPYTQTFAGGGPSYTGAQVPVVPLAAPPARRFPTGAIWLIGLGALFLLGEFSQDWGWSWSINHNWVLAALFAGLAVWSFTRKLHPGVQIVCILRWPLVLAVLAAMFALQAVDVVSLGRTWPLLFIVFGVMLILERTALANMSYGGAGSPASTSVVPGPLAPGSAEAEAERTRAAWAAANPEHPGSHGQPDSGNNDLTKSGGL